MARLAASLVVAQEAVLVLLLVSPILRSWFQIMLPVAKEPIKALSTTLDA